MKTQPDRAPTLDGTELATINAALAPSTVFCIESMTQPDPKHRRGVDFQCIDHALAAAERLVAVLGHDTVVPGSLGYTAGGLLAYVQGIAQLASPYRPPAELLAGFV